MRLSFRKFLSIILLSLLLGVYYHHSWSQKRLLGRDAYLVAEGKHFDEFLATPRSLPHTFALSFVLIGIVVGSYELLAAVLSKFLKEDPISPLDAMPPR